MDSGLIKAGPTSMQVPHGDAAPSTNGYIFARGTSTEKSKELLDRVGAEYA